MNAENPEPGRIIRATLAAVGVALAFFLLYFFREILFVLLIGIILGMALQPLVRASGRLGGGRSANVLIVYSMVVLVFAMISVLAIPRLVEQAANLAENLPVLYQELRTSLIEAQGELAFLAFRLPSLDGLPSIVNGFASFENGAPAAMGSLTIILFKAVIYTIAIFMLAAFWSLERNWLIKTFGTWLGPKKGRQLEALANSLEKKVGAFIRAQTILSLSVALASFIAYLIIGLPYPFALAVLAGIMEAVPIFGPTLGAIPAGLVASSMGWGPVLSVVIAYIAIQALENSLLVPNVMDQSVGVHPVLTLVSLITLASILGVVGGILAIPFASALQVIYRELRSEMAEAPLGPEGRGSVSLLRYRAHLLMQDLAAPADHSLFDLSEETRSMRMEFESIVMSLDHLLADLEAEEQNS